MESLIKIIDITGEDCTQQIRKVHSVLENMAIEELSKIVPNIEINNAVILNQPMNENCYNCAHQTPAFGANYCINYPKYNIEK